LHFTVLVLLGGVLLATILRTAPWREPAPLPTAISTINVNSAPWWELALLPGIGETLARRIVSFREGAAGGLEGDGWAERDGRAAQRRRLRIVFSCADDLRGVRGIGPRKTQGMAPYLRFD